MSVMSDITCNMKMSKQYGLIVPGTAPKPVQTSSGTISKTNVFGDDSDSDSESQVTRAPLGPGVNQKRQARLAQEKAISDDPTVYQYDEVYDEMEAKKAENKLNKSKQEKKPKYITRLLETADKRKKEYERRIERQVQKELEAEGDEFKDKESFVTSSYRKKLEEMKKLEEQEKREDYLESIGDVTKQQDLDGFYRHLYSQKLGDEKQIEIPNETKTSPVKTTCSMPPENSKPDQDDKVKAKRVYRKRSISVEGEDDSSAKDHPKVHLQSNWDADSDFSIDSSDSDDEVETKPTEPKNESRIGNDPGNNSDTVGVTVIKEENIDAKLSKQWNDGFKIPEKVQKFDGEAKIKNDVAEKKVKVDIWKKRTVGDALTAAIERYYIRKAQRSA